MKDISICTSKDKEVGLNDITYGTLSLTVSKWQSQTSKLGLSNSKVHLLPTK